MQRLSAALVLLLCRLAVADSTSGVDAVLSRSSYDSNGLFSLEGARLMPRRDLAFKLQLAYAKSPLDVAVPGIGDGGKDPILDYVVTLDMTFGMTLTDRVAIGLDIGGYRTATDVGYGTRGRYQSGGMIASPSSGVIALRPLSNIDPSADPGDRYAYLGDGVAGPLDARVGIKLALLQEERLALAAVGSVFLPFGEDQMLLGDKNLVFEPKLTLELRPDRFHQTKLVANLAFRFRNRAILEGYDTSDPMATADDAKVYLDVGSEVVTGVGAVYELTPRVSVAGEVNAFVPMPSQISWGKCTRYSGLACSSLASADYWPGAKAGDFTMLGVLGALFRVSADVTADVTLSTGQFGARGDDFRITTGIVWAPQPEGVAAPGRNDRDGDYVPDTVDACPDEAEDRDGFQDEDGCPDADNDNDGISDADDACPNEPEDKDGFQDNDGCPEHDNDKDGIPDAADKCANDAEDKDGFEDDDGCPDEDNDGDGIPDATDKCPNDPETVNSFEDDDGCPDVRATTGPEERPDRIDLKGQSIEFDKTGKLTTQSRTLLGQVAAIIKARKLTIRVEVHVPLGTKSASAAQIKAQKTKDKTAAQKRAAAIQEFLVAQGLAQTQVQSVGIGSDRPLGTAAPTDAINDRVDFIKAQQGTP